MKLNKIFTIFIVLATLFSCTAEDGVLNDMDKSNNKIEMSGDKTAVLSVAVNAETPMTKTTISGPTEGVSENIHSNVLFLLEKTNDTDYKVAQCIWKSADSNNDKNKVVTKVQDNLYIFVVANPGNEFGDELVKCTTYQEIKDIILGLNDIKAKSRPMYNKELVKVSFEGATSTTADGLTEYTVPVTVQQSVACISLYNFTVDYVGNVSNELPAVKLTSVKFSGMKTKATLFGEVETEDYFAWDELVPQSGYDALIKNESTSTEEYRTKLANLQKLFLTAYPNTTNPVVVDLAFTVGTGKFQRTENRTYTINPTSVAGSEAGIHAGFWYNLNVTVKVGADINVDLVCKTLDWKDNSYDIAVEEIK